MITLQQMARIKYRKQNDKKSATLFFIVTKKFLSSLFIYFYEKNWTS